MIKALILKRVIAMAISLALATAVPFATKKSPVIQWTWDNLGPVIVERANSRFDVKIKTPGVTVDVKSPGVDVKVPAPPTPGT